MPAVPLLGRDHESEVISDMLDGLPERGGALVTRGEAGIGKSALLAQASALAAAGGMQVMRATGVQSETNLSFAGLHRLLRPLLPQVDRLSAHQREALMAAFGVIDGEAPDRFLIALAALNVLGDAATRSPVVLIAEDAQWLDAPTADVLAFVGRRIESDPIVLLAAMRDGYEHSPLSGGLRELHLDPLADDPARALLDRHFPDLATTLHERVLDEAGGNPLALLELPLALESRGREWELLPTHLPLTARLEHAFASRAAELPSATRTLLRIAAVDDGDLLAEIMSAAEIVDGVAPTIEALVPAVEAQLIDMDGTSVRFRHPLVRSAIYQAASVAERHAAHAALAVVLADDPDRRVWHRASATIGEDPVIASELEQAAGRAQRRGASALAVAAFERAATFTTQPAQRGALLLRAAVLARELGRNEMVMRLLREANSLELGSRDRARSMWLEESFHRGVAGDPGRVHALVETAERMIADGDTDLALNLLSAAALKCFRADPGERARAEVVRAAERAGVDATDPRLLFIQGSAATIERGAAVIERLPSDTSDADPDALYLLGAAAYAVGAMDRAASLLATSVARLRDQGRLGLLPQVLVAQAWSAIQQADWNVAIPAAEEAGRLARETGQPLWEAGAAANAAVVAALRGQPGVETLAANAEAVALPAGSTATLAAVEFARGLQALGQGDHVTAYEHLRRLYAPGDPANHLLSRCCAIGDLAEAAAHSGGRDEGLAFVGELEPLAQQTPSSWFHVALIYARPLLAAEADAESLFRDALATDLSRWPLYRARLQLAFGEWLRRRRRMAESRAPLRAARDAFDALGMDPWGRRARQELRASGESSRQRTPEARDELTAQELQIAQMAAGGLSNREIGQRLYLSHRTVESHLYRVFPKLGVTSRAQLSAALGSGPAQPS